MILDFKPFYIHANKPRRRHDHATIKACPRGFTCFIEPSGNDRTVNVQIIHCAYTDDFCKKEGRSFAHQQVKHEINARDLPAFLHDAKMACWPIKMRHQDTGNYNWVLKYLL